MNIKQAKEQIRNTLRAYLRAGRAGQLPHPAVRQRPVLLMGPPGIGKTQIMEQIAAEENVGLVSYTITHHTRQSAIGLPFIEKRVYDGVERTVTEYTMSEIIGSVYALTEKTGIREGILFLDEINCVSETLAPMMLQFLQCKTFGNQKLPEGWLIVAAGNPPEYNRSVRDFDVVTLDRVKRIEVTEDFAVWKEYALRKGPARRGGLLSRSQEGELLPHRKQPRGDAVCHRPRLGGSERDPLRLRGPGHRAGHGACGAVHPDAVRRAGFHQLL